jgi:hypothetical protein
MVSIFVFSLIASYGLVLEIAALLRVTWGWNIHLRRACWVLRVANIMIDVLTSSSSAEQTMEWRATGSRCLSSSIMEADSLRYELGFCDSCSQSPYCHFRDAIVVGHLCLGSEVDGFHVPLEVHTS